MESPPYTIGKIHLRDKFYGTVQKEFVGILSDIFF